MSYLGRAWPRLPRNQRTADALYAAAVALYLTDRQRWVDGYGERLFVRFGHRLSALANSISGRLGNYVEWTDDPAAIAWSIAYLRWDEMVAAGRVQGPPTREAAEWYAERHTAKQLFLFRQSPHMPR